MDKYLEIVLAPMKSIKCCTCTGFTCNCTEVCRPRSTITFFLGEGILLSSPITVGDMLANMFRWLFRACFEANCTIVFCTAKIFFLAGYLTIRSTAYSARVFLESICSIWLWVESRLINKCISAIS